MTTDNRTQVSRTPIITLIADDDYLFRITVRRLLEQAPEVSVVGEANDGEEAIQLAQELQPDLVLMDISMPRLDGLEATRRIKAEQPEVKIIVLTVHREEVYRKTAYEYGADAFLIKKTVGVQLIPTIIGFWCPPDTSPAFPLPWEIAISNQRSAFSFGQIPPTRLSAVPFTLNPTPCVVAPSPGKQRPIARQRA